MMRMEIRRQYAAVRGQTLQYLKAGSGPPIVFIHGLLGGSFCWRFNVPALAQRFTSLAVDLPGFGETVTAPDLDCGMEAQAFRLLSWLEQMDFRRVDMIASSWGAGVALLVAAATPRIRSLVLAAPVNPWSDFGMNRVRFFSGRTGAAILRLGMPFSRPMHRIALERMYGDPARIPAGTLEGYSRIMLRKGRAQNLVNTLRRWEKDLRALHGALEKVQVPSLLIWGSKDTAVDIRSAGALMQKMRGCERAVIAGAGHLPFEETPEEFNRLVLSFLERISARAEPA
jgi:pimeloyl-ACP methyl ester carboxylesterase